VSDAVVAVLQLAEYLSEGAGHVVKRLPTPLVDVVILTIAGFHVVV